jgi:sugar lactone lactonase YvrE
MGTKSITPPFRRPAGFFRALVFLWLVACSLVSSRAQSPNVPLLLPSGLAFDAVGNLYFAQTRSHIVRRLTPAGVLTVVAGTGTQGYAGDGGPATAALLDSPAGVAVDAAGDLWIADTHNHCIRRVDAVTGLISTSNAATARLPVALAFSPAGQLVFADAGLHQILQAGTGTVVAGDGTQGFSGDGGQATAAEIDSPYGLAFDTAGNLYIADTHNQRIRRVDATTGIITTVAGTGVPGFAGDGGVATSAQMSLPRGIAVDSSGNLYVADARNHRIRRIDAVTGVMTTIAGNATQAFLGDGSQAVTASLDSPKAVAISGAGLPTLSDSANNRVRQVESAATIQTIAGVGAIVPQPPPGQATATTTVLTATNAQTLTTTVSSASGTPGGTVTLIDAVTPVASATLVNGSATFATGILSNGSHTLTASYAGSSAYLASVSLPIIVSTGPTAIADFTLTANPVVSSTVVAGQTATFSFTVAPTNAPLSSPLSLAVTGVPTGATAAFNPSSLLPSAGPNTFLLSVTTPVSARLTQPFDHRRGWGWPALACVVLVIPLAVRRRRGVLLAGVLLLAGCGARVTNSGASGPVTYNMTVTASYTTASGLAVSHSVAVPLTVE